MIYCITSFLTGPSDPRDPSFRGRKGQKGHLFSEFPNQYARALLHHPLPPPLLRMQLVVAMPADLSPRTRREEFKLLLGQFPPTVITSHTR